MSDLMLAVISKIEDPKKFIIRFSIPELIEDCIAYPIEVTDEPEVGEPIVVFGLESILGTSYIWMKQRLLDYTKLKLGESLIEIKEDAINIISKDSSIEVSNSGDIKIKGSKVEITGGKLVTKGTPNTDTLGPYCSIKFCPFSGAPHTGSEVSGT